MLIHSSETASLLITYENELSALERSLHTHMQEIETCQTSKEFSYVKQQMHRMLDNIQSQKAICSYIRR